MCGVSCCGLVSQSLFTHNDLVLYYDDDVAHKTRIRILDEAVYCDSILFLSFYPCPLTESQLGDVQLWPGR